MQPRTEKQAQILTFIQTFMERRGATPTYAMIAKYMGVKSRATVAKHIKALERRGLISRTHEGGEFDLVVTQNGVRCPRCNHEFLFQGTVK